MEYTNNKYGKPRKKKHYGWRMFLCFLGGMVFAVAATCAGAAVTGSVVPTNQVVTMFGADPNDILGEDYRDLSIIETIIALSKAQYETLGDLNEITPMVEKTVKEKINPILLDSVHYEFDWDELKIKPFVKSTSGRPATEVDPNQTLEEYIPDALMNGISLETFIQSANNLLKFFLYPYTFDEETQMFYFDVDHPYSIQDYISAGEEFFNRIINSITIGDLIENASTDPLLSQIKDWKLADFNQENLLTLKIGSLFSQEQREQNPLLEAIYVNDWSINDLINPENINGLKICEVIDLSNASPLVTKIGNFTVGELSTVDLTQEITVNDVYPDAVEGDLMFALKDKTIAELADPEVFLDLKVGVVIKIEENNFLETYKDYTLRELTHLSTADLELFDFFESDEIDANQILKALYTIDSEMKIKDLSDYDVISRLLLKDILPSDFGTNKILTSLIAKNVTIGGLSDAINELTLEDVVDLNGTIFNKVGIKDVKIMNAGDLENAIKTRITVGDLLGEVKDAPAILNALKNETISTLPDRLKVLTLGDVVDLEGTIFDHEEIASASISDAQALQYAFMHNVTLGGLLDINSSSPKILQTLQDTTLSEVANKVSTLTLNQIIDIDSSSPKILQSLAGVAIFSADNNLEEALTNLKFNQIYDFEDCNSDVMKAIWESGDNGNFAITDLPRIVNEMPLIVLMGDKIYDDPQTGRINPTWWLLLTEEGETFTDEERLHTLKNGASYTLNDIEKLVANLEYHMASDSILTLVEAGFIVVDADKLDVLKNTPYPLDSSRKLGDLTISEFTNYVLSLI